MPRKGRGHWRFSVVCRRPSVRGIVPGYDAARGRGDEGGSGYGAGDWRSEKQSSGGTEEDRAHSVPYPGAGRRHLSKLHQKVENSAMAQTAILKRIAEKNAAVARDEEVARALAVEVEGERRLLESRAKALSGEIDRDEEIARAFQRGLEETVGSFGGERVGPRTNDFPRDYNSNVDTSQVDQDHMIALSLAQENFESDVDPYRYS